MPSHDPLEMAREYERMYTPEQRAMMARLFHEVKVMKSGAVDLGGVKASRPMDKNDARYDAMLARHQNYVARAECRVVEAAHAIIQKVPV